MTKDDIADAERLRAMVVAIMGGAASAEPTQLGGTAVDGTTMVRAFQFITAAMLEAHPELATDEELREATRLHGAQMLGFIKRFRQDFERTGEHAWDLINAPPERMH